jgi:hypothetical protein
VYWATCWGVAAALLGPRRLAALWHAGDTALPDPRSLAAAVLVVPPAITRQWMPYAREAGPVAIASAAGVGVTNALAEEALWRGVPIALFPGAPVRVVSTVHAMTDAGGVRQVRSMWLVGGPGSTSVPAPPGSTTWIGGNSIAARVGNIPLRRLPE